MKTDIKEFRLKLYPKDFYKVRNFYENDLGFTVTKEWDHAELEKGVMFQVGNTTLELLSPKDSYHKVSGVDVSWEILNVHELWQDWKDKPNVVFAIRDNDWGDTSFCISDPEGFKITFFTKYS
jgi:hypothetical protein